MADARSGQADDVAQRGRALARWTNEGGAPDRTPIVDVALADMEADDLELTSAEAAHLRVRARHPRGHGLRHERRLSGID